LSVSAFRKLRLSFRDQEGICAGLANARDSFTWKTKPLPGSLPRGNVWNTLFLYKEYRMALS